MTVADVRPLRPRVYVLCFSPIQELDGNKCNKVTHNTYQGSTPFCRLTLLMLTTAPPRHEAQQKRREVLIKRRKEFQRQLRQQEKEAQAARAATAAEARAWHAAALGSRKFREAVEIKRKGRGGRTQRIVRAAGAMKVLRSRVFGAEDGGGRGGVAALFAAGSTWTTRLAKSITNRIDVNDAERESERSDGDGRKLRGNGPWALSF